jgi:hypothetical protein
MPVILATQGAEIRRVEVRSQPGQIVLKTLYQKPLHKNRTGGVAQRESPEFKSQYCKTKKIKNEDFCDPWVQLKHMVFCHFFMDEANCMKLQLIALI